MQVTVLGVLPPPSGVMRSEDYVRERAVRLRGEPGTASQKIGRVLNVVYEWHRASRRFLAPHRDHLIMERSLDWRDIYVHPARGGLVFKELPNFKLQEPAVAFKEDGRRTMNRLLAKAEAELKTALDIRLLSALYWIAAYCAILDHRDR